MQVPINISLYGGVTPAAVVEPSVGALLRLVVACSLGVPLADVTLTSVASASTSLSCSPSDPVNLPASGQCSPGSSSTQTSTLAMAPSPSTGRAAPSSSLTVVSVLVTACGVVNAAAAVSVVSSSLAQCLAVWGKATDIAGSLGGSPLFGSFLLATAAASGVPPSAVTVASTGVGPAALAAPSAAAGGASNKNGGGSATGLSPAALGGMATALGLVAILLLVCACWMLLRKRKADRKAQRDRLPVDSNVPPQSASGVNPMHSIRMTLPAHPSPVLPPTAGGGGGDAAVVAGTNPITPASGPRAARTVSSPVALYESAAAGKLRSAVGRSKPAAHVSGAPAPRGPRSISSASSGAPLELTEDLVFKANPLHRPRGASKQQEPVVAASTVRATQVILSGSAAASLAAAPQETPEVDVFAAELFDFKSNPLHVSKRRIA